MPEEKGGLAAAPSISIEWDETSGNGDTPTRGASLDNDRAA
jgi:hypothetical protein